MNYSIFSSLIFLLLIHKTESEQTIQLTANCKDEEWSKSRAFTLTPNAVHYITCKPKFGVNYHLSFQITSKITQFIVYFVSSQEKCETGDWTFDSDEIPDWDENPSQGKQNREWYAKRDDFHSIGSINKRREFSSHFTYTPEKYGDMFCFMIKDDMISRM